MYKAELSPKELHTQVPTQFLLFLACKQSDEKLGLSLGLPHSM